MDSLPLLIFDLNGMRFGLDARAVRESLWLPELTPVEEAPAWIVGLFNLRGKIVPVADLDLRFGHPPGHYGLSNQVVLLEANDLPMGLIVSEVREVVELPLAAIQAPPQLAGTDRDKGHLVVGEAHVGDDLVTLLDASLLALMPQRPEQAEATARSPATGYFCPQATPELRAQFHARALALKEDGVKEEGSRMGLAVVGLGGEYFGIELAAVQEFCDIRQLCPIPCCPPHILGVMSLRGDLFTLIDPISALNLPPAVKTGGKAVVGRRGEQAVGIAVDDVHDVVYLRTVEMQPPPLALRERNGAEIMGTAPYGSRIMTVLDLPSLLAREEWIVNEKV
ncbi:MAG: purine-binding chemotaxis protein CheW [Rhodospirillales bacterium]|nr:MAG: purine-binding chemotaxis protein CheW [Rhodospirillales bacterium]